MKCDRTVFDPRTEPRDERHSKRCFPLIFDSVASKHTIHIHKSYQDIRNTTTTTIIGINDESFVLEGGHNAQHHATHPGGEDWELESLVPNPSSFGPLQLHMTFLLIATIFEKVAALPDVVFQRLFFQFNPTVPYIKTKRLREDDFTEMCPTLATLITSFHTHDLDCYLQLYTGSWLKAGYLTSIH